jgi:hypothetical protein
MQPICRKYNGLDLAVGGLQCAIVTPSILSPLNDLFLQGCLFSRATWARLYMYIGFLFTFMWYRAATVRRPVVPEPAKRRL